MHLLLLGGGHSHIAVLKAFGMHPEPGLHLTLISRSVETPYSGMLPGVVAGHYTRADAQIDLHRLAAFAGARLIVDDAAGLDLEARQVVCRSRPPVPFDLLSINIGSTPDTSVPGALEHAIPVKPIDRFLARWDDLRERLLAAATPVRVAIVGGGAGGVELLLAIEYRVRSLLASAGRSSRRPAYSLFTATDTILPTHNRRAQRMIGRILENRGVAVYPATRIDRVAPGVLRAADGRTFEADEILWATEAAPSPWLGASGLATDEHGFVSVSAMLESTSHPGIFAAGDVASMPGRPLEKSGVYAVRQGPVLAANLRRAARGRALRAYRPQRRFLSLISTGDRSAVASRGPLACSGRWVWRWKDRIDRRFVRRYQELPVMPPEGGLAPATMRCAGCGAKVSAAILSRVLGRIDQVKDSRVVVGLREPDDAAVVEAPGDLLAVHTVDFFRAMVSDPYLFGRIAATHALGDLYAMGAAPHTALAIVTIPPEDERTVERVLTDLLAGAVGVLADAGAVLVGGHTSEGAELALGFSVNGTVARAGMLRKGGLRPGDGLVLTKPIGTGTLFAADMRRAAAGTWIAAAIESMTQPAGPAASCLVRHGATACTDVTGFGLAGHLLEMLAASGVDAEVDLAAVACLEGAEQTAGAGLLSSLQPQNERARTAIAAAAAAMATPRFLLLFDPQTCGGLLAGIPSDRVEACIQDLQTAGYAHAAVVGRVVPRAGEEARIAVR